MGDQIKVKKFLGAGGFGFVFKVEHSLYGTTALKIPRRWVLN